MAEENIPIVRNKNETPRPMFDTKRFLEDHYRDADAVIGLLSAFHLPTPNHEQTRKWFSRGSVPADWFPILLCAVELETGQAVRLAAYITREAQLK